ncbi:MAG: nucleotide exchange factor GrpE [Alphaproteobacteria bacterium]|nr:nucleotide exchange factor GrpE [Alphaproteobacteria bacterium]
MNKDTNSQEEAEILEAPEQEEKTEETAKEEKEDIMLEAAEKIRTLEAEVAKLKDKYVRAHAEMENVRRRAQAEIKKKTTYAVSEFAKELLSVADNLARALQSVPKENSEENKLIKDMIVGIEMTEKELNNVFERHGIKLIEAVDKIYNPNFHQVIQELEDPSKINGTIIHEVQAGYMIKDRLLRESMVVVSKGGAKNEEKETPLGKKIDTTA